MIINNISSYQKRINEINEIVDNNIPNSIILLIKKFSNNLENYKYIESVEEFSLLKLRGSFKYINKYDGNLRSGGLLIKIYKKDNNWYGIIKQISGKIYHVSFNSNHIFYIESKSESLRNWANYFITDYEKGKYVIN